MRQFILKTILSTLKFMIKSIFVIVFQLAMGITLLMGFIIEKIDNKH